MKFNHLPNWIREYYGWDDSNIKSIRESENGETIVITKRSGGRDRWQFKEVSRGHRDWVLLRHPSDA